MAGTVRISRDIFGHECFADEPLTEREAWVWLIMEAAWKPHTRRVGDYIVDVDRGQVAASVRFMASAWKWTPAKVQRFTKRLIRLGMISAKTDTGVSVITICNYDEYQAPADAADTGAIQVRYRSDTKEKEGKEREEGKEIGSLDREPAEVAEALAEFNGVADRAGWPKANVLSQARRKAIRARLTDAGGLDGWRIAMAKAEASDFLCGRTDKAWNGFCLDWVAKAQNFTKLMEGNYDNRPGRAQPSDPALRAIARAASAFEASPVDWRQGRGAA